MANILSAVAEWEGETISEKTRAALAVEDRVERGLNYNLVTEVGAMLMTGRRVALLKDGSIEKMPTDFVGMIYKSVDLSDEGAVRVLVTNWLRDDLRMGKI
ncbi:MAG: hypothetical protein ACYCZK_03835 [Microbacteriaceae bacterium]